MNGLVCIVIFRNFVKIEIMSTIKTTDLLINPDGSIYHLALRPEQLADHVIVVGDPGRVNEISGFFDHVECKVQNREFITHTGTYRGKRITALSTGIGTDNIDIVINELDALANVDLATRKIKDTHKTLHVVRIGTSGALQEDLPVHAFALSSYGLGFDNLIHFYNTSEAGLDCQMSDAFVKHTGWNPDLSRPYFVKGSERLISLFSKDMVSGITATATGFYGPQGRVLRLGLNDPELNAKIQSFRYGKERVINFEMETSALYGLGGMLGHEMATVCLLIANRATLDYSTDHKPYIRKLFGVVLDTLASL
jgi:uridine phosphorylase